jgi:hypothetical protein
MRNKSFTEKEVDQLIRRMLREDVEEYHKILKQKQEIKEIKQTEEQQDQKKKVVEELKNLFIQNRGTYYNGEKIRLFKKIAHKHKMMSNCIESFNRNQKEVEELVNKAQQLDKLKKEHPLIDRYYSVQLFARIRFAQRCKKCTVERSGNRFLDMINFFSSATCAKHNYSNLD